MHILIANFSQMVTDRANIAIANKDKVSYRLSIGIFTFGLAWPIVQFPCQYLANGDRANIVIANK